MAFLLIPLAIGAAIVKHKNDEAERHAREREQAERANLERERAHAQAELERQGRQRIEEYSFPLNSKDIRMWHLLAMFRSASLHF